MIQIKRLKLNSKNISDEVSKLCDETSFICDSLIFISKFLFALFDDSNVWVKLGTM